MMHHINRLPVINGFEAIKEVRKKLNSDIPIIALTADVTVNDLEKCKEVGINDHIAKPIDEKRLFNKIIELVKKDETKKTSFSSQEKRNERV